MNALLKDLHFAFTSIYVGEQPDNLTSTMEWLEASKTLNHSRETTERRLGSYFAQGAKSKQRRSGTIVVWKLNLITRWAKNPIISGFITRITGARVISYNPSYPFIRPFIGVRTLLITSRGPPCNVVLKLNLILANSFAIHRAPNLEENCHKNRFKSNKT